jgi:hypothetical protein
MESTQTTDCAKINELTELLDIVLKVINGCDTSKELLKNKLNQRRKVELKVMKFEERDESKLFDYLINNITVVLSKLNFILLEKDLKAKERLTEFIQMIVDGLKSNLNSKANTLTYWFYILQLHQLIELISQLEGFNPESMIGLFSEYSVEICDCEQTLTEVKFY